MKRILCLCLALALLLGLTLPAAADGQEEALKEVILRVKETLDISDEYESFQGDSYTRGGSTWWYLYWSGQEDSLNVTCDENGKVYSLDRWFYDDSSYYGYSSRSLHFPAFGYEDALALAEAFLPRVLGAGETVTFEERQDSLRQGSRYNLWGSLALNGVETEIGVSLSFRVSDGMLLSFNRDDQGMFISGGVPSPVPALSASDALKIFRGEVSTSLSWDYEDYESHTARLNYTFSLDSWRLMLDANTGEFVDRWSGYRTGGGYENYDMAEEAAAEAPSPKASLTPVEIAGAEMYAGALDAEALRTVVRAEKAFGITEDYVIGPVSYHAAPGVDPLTLKEGEEPPEGVTADFTLTWQLTGPAVGLSQEEYDELTEMGYTPAIHKNFTADALTGEILSLYTYASGFGWEERETEENPVISDLALDFIQRHWGEELKLCEQTEAFQSAWGLRENSFRYTRMEAGYPAPMNYVYVTVCDATGTVDSFNCAWDEALTFGPAGPVVGEDAALDTYMASWEAVLRYVTLPDDPEDWESPWHWLLVYFPEQTGWVWSVDAVTGETATYEEYEEPVIAYSDIAGSYAREALETLAKYGVGWYGMEKLEPATQVTELDMLLLMLSATGHRLDYGTYRNAPAEELQWLWDEGYYQGYVSSREVNPDRPVTRSELCRCFVGLAGLGEAAELKGIYATGFADEADIAGADLGYVALAKGLGVVEGDENGAFRPADSATRQELAVMLYRYLAR